MAFKLKTFWSKLKTCYKQYRVVLNKNEGNTFDGFINTSIA